MRSCSRVFLVDGIAWQFLIAAADGRRTVLYRLQQKTDLALKDVGLWLSNCGTFEVVPDDCPFHPWLAYTIFFSVTLLSRRESSGRGYGRRASRAAPCDLFSERAVHSDRRHREEDICRTRHGGPPSTEQRADLSCQGRRREFVVSATVARQAQHIRCLVSESLDFWGHG